MIGYHYTSYDNWRRIQSEGIMPYVLRRDIVHDGVPGIWIFKDMQQGTSHAGCILFQINSKRTFHVVELEVEYRQEWTVREGWEDCDVLHEGRVLDDKGWLIGHYHKSARAVIVWKPIRPELIRMIGDYQFKDAWKRNDHLSVGIQERASVVMEDR